jgi:hypothetical protein
LIDLARTQQAAATFHQLYLSADAFNIIDRSMFEIFNRASPRSSPWMVVLGTAYPFIDQLFRFVIPHP